HGDPTAGNKWLRWSRPTNYSKSGTQLSCSSRHRRLTDSSKERSTSRTRNIPSLFYSTKQERRRALTAYITRSATTPTTSHIRQRSSSIVVERSGGLL